MDVAPTDAWAYLEVHMVSMRMVVMRREDDLKEIVINCIAYDSPQESRFLAFVM